MDLPVEARLVKIKAFAEARPRRDWPVIPLRHSGLLQAGHSCEIEAPAPAERVFGWAFFYYNWY